MSDATAIDVSSDPDRVDLRLAHRWIASSYWATNVPWEVFERACAGSLLFGAFRGDEMVGFARVVSDQATFGWLCDVYVADEERGQGVGRALMEAVMGDQRLDGLRHFILRTRDAHGLYEKLGFEPLGERHREFMLRFRSAAELYSKKPLD